MDSKLHEVYLENSTRRVTIGNIYKGVITRVEPGLQSVFVEYGVDRHGFLQKNEIHSDYYQDHSKSAANLPKKLSVTDMVKSGQELLVQVTKDPILKKGAVLTTFISLAGRHLVLMPGSNSRGVSRKIEADSQRNHLKEIINKLEVPDNFGIIVRTAGHESNKTVMAKDLRYLLRLWKGINQKGIDAPAPILLHKEQNPVLRFLRDYFTNDVVEILVDQPQVYQEVKNFLKIIAPKQVKIIKQYKAAKPLFTKFQLEEQISSIFKNQVSLKSGGSIVIDQTEALVAIDVNSGKAIHTKSVEQTAFQANIEAGEEISRQLRLRDLGGLVVIDFIDMRDSKHKLEVEKNLKSHLKADKARTSVGKISKFGLLEMSRQRIRASLETGAYIPCRHCYGKGRIPSPETISLAHLRKLKLESLKAGITRIRTSVPVEVADYLLNHKRREILELETEREISIRIEGVRNLLCDQSEIFCE